MRHLIRLLIVLALCTVYSCGRQQRVANDVAVNDNDFDFSQFYRVNETSEYIYDAHRNVPLGESVTLRIRQTFRQTATLQHGNTAL